MTAGLYALSQKSQTKIHIYGIIPIPFYTILAKIFDFGSRLLSRHQTIDLSVV